ncbi:mannose-6-phosphate isomerase, putative [Ricinus communis]|uniref:mannose-6-phosphate isomerase n=1 Tax=Ricinus communis TaxID=3988 RepID=B9SZQ6_RICCO|nr:mannose-6-phosphate isomerase, putative [Ricinus communis]
MDAELKNQGLKRLRCSVQNYNWGKIGSDSQVAKLYALNSGSEIEVDKPYAELWMGTHDSGPSFVVESGGENGIGIGSQSLSLKDWIAKNPNVLGDKVLDKWGCDLPFLFKELKAVLQNIPEIVELVGTADAKQVLHVNEQDGEEKVKSVVRSIFTQLMSASKEMITEVISKLKIRLHMESQVRQLTDKEQLILQLEKQYPADIGVISAFFFNYVKLNPGEALYLGANEPHAYLYGECIECMATSDNVVRAGLTPKHRDVQTLCSMLTYKQGFPEILKGFPLSPYIRRYLPPFDEFEVDSCILSKGESTVFPAVPGPSIFVVTAGKGMMHTGLSKEVVGEGDVLFAPANIEINVTTSSELRLYRAGVNSRFFQRL